MHMVTFTPFRKRNELFSKLPKDNPNSVNSVSITEKLVHEQVYCCFNDNNILCKQQYAVFVLALHVPFFMFLRLYIINGI